ncbi:hypothetical protein [Pantoea ananatis]|nr:hypothetical protein [Pantoea ananatis]
MPAAEWSLLQRLASSGVGQFNPIKIWSFTLSRTYGGQGLSYEMHAI